MHDSYPEPLFYFNLARILCPDRREMRNLCLYGSEYNKRNG